MRVVVLQNTTMYAPNGYKSNAIYSENLRTADSQVIYIKMGFYEKFLKKKYNPWTYEESRLLLHCKKEEEIKTFEEIESLLLDSSRLEK